MPADILLSTVNARYQHAAFGLRYLLANMGDLQGNSQIREFDLTWRPIDIAGAILAIRPKILGLGVYIWNLHAITEIAGILKQVAPEIVIVIGGPEVSYESEDLPLTALADFVISGEADLEFPKLCRRILDGTTAPGPSKFISAPTPDLSSLCLPYTLYSDQDIANRLVYVEASRGCPFTCEFCLSSLDIPTRQFPLDRFLAEMQALLDRGLSHFKFVDRTFNLNLRVSQAILDFFLRQPNKSLFLHFEMVPDRLPDALREQIQAFPPGMLQFEVGIQTFNPEVAERISRRQNYDKLEENLRFLHETTHVHIHADLIVGLPGEDLRSFASGFDRLLALKPHEIQVGILKKLRGTPISRHSEAWGMRYTPVAPYEVLQTSVLSFSELQSLRRFARFWDLNANSGRFTKTLPLLWTRVEEPQTASPFWGFWDFSEWLFLQTGQTHSIALPKLTELLLTYLTSVKGIAAELAAARLLEDFSGIARKDIPPVLRPYLPEAESQPGFIGTASSESSSPHPSPSSPHARRQARHRKS